jgi:hypothetical protein
MIHAIMLKGNDLIEGKMKKLNAIWRQNQLKSRKCVSAITAVVPSITKRASTLTLRLVGESS